MERTNNRLIAKNTFLLYLRMLVIMVITLFTSRVVLDQLGVNDYGIYNLVGGVVVFFSFVNNALLSATQRFLNFAIGKHDNEYANRVFSLSVRIYLTFSVIIFILGEIVGVYFVNNVLNISPDRMFAANIVYQFSLFGFIINFLRIPYNACIVSYEKMNFYAYISIVEVVLKLFVVYLLGVLSFDKLVLYSCLITIILILINLCYYVYCRKKFIITKYNNIYDKELIKQLMGFSGWSLFGSLSNISVHQGFSLLLNLFYGVAANAAMGIANQVNSAVNSFVSSFQTAFTPQIVKLYANDSMEEFVRLIIRTSKFSYIVFFIPSAFLYINIEEVFSIWLVDVPSYATSFCRIILLCSLVDALTGPYYRAIQATGQIKKYQLCISFSFLLDLMLSFILFFVSVPLEYILYSRLLTRGFINMIIGLCFMYRLFHFPFKIYIKNTVFPIILYSFVVVFLSSIVGCFFEGFQKIISIAFINIPISISLAYFFLLSGSERKFILDVIKFKLKK